MNLLNDYVSFLKPFIKTKSKVRVAIDCSNGSTGPIIEELFKNHPDIDVVSYNTDPNGEFPAHGPNPLAEEAISDLEREVKESKADMGIIFDGDGDRVAFADEKGEMIDPYIALSAMAKQCNPPFVVDVRAIADFTMKELDVIEERVGRYFIIRTMRERKAELGGEYSGHYYFKDFFYSDSGILATIFMINYASSILSEGKSVSEATQFDKGYVRMPEFNFSAKDQDGEMAIIKSHFKDLGYEINEKDGVTVLGDNFAFNLRASFTEPTLRLNLVAETDMILDKTLSEIKEVLNIK